MPVYLVELKTDPAQTRIVDAPTKSSAVNHVIKGLVSAAPLSASEVVTHIQSGVTVESVGAKDAQPEPAPEPEPATQPIEQPAGEAGDSFGDVVA